MTAAYVAGSWFTMGMSGPFLIDAGVPLAVLGALNGVGGVVAGLIGAVAGSLLVRRVGARSAVVLAAGAQAGVLAIFAAVVVLGYREPAAMAGLVTAHSVAVAFAYVALYSLLMGAASQLQAGVDFTLFQCADALVAGLGGFGGGMLAAAFGYPTCFAAAAALSLVGVRAAWLLAPRLAAGLEHSRP